MSSGHDTYPAAPSPQFLNLQTPTFEKASPTPEKTIFSRDEPSQSPESNRPRITSITNASLSSPTPQINAPRKLLKFGRAFKSNLMLLQAMRLENQSGKALFSTSFRIIREILPASSYAAAA